MTDTRFPVEKDWCWRAAERRANGLPAPEDPRACLSPCPGTTERARRVLDIVQLAGRQLRVSFGGVVGLDWTVIARLADDCGVETDEAWWQLVAAAEGELVIAMTPKTPEEGGKGG